MQGRVLVTHRFHTPIYASSILAPATIFFKEIKMITLVAFTNILADIVVIIGGVYIMYKAKQLINYIKTIEDISVQNQTHIKNISHKMNVVNLKNKLL